MCLGKVLKKVLYVGLDSLYIKVSGILVLVDVKVGFFVGIINRVESRECAERSILRDAYGVVLYSERFYSQNGCYDALIKFNYKEQQQQQQQ